MKDKIKEIEEKLRNLRAKPAPLRASSSSEKKVPEDHSDSINTLVERLEHLENYHDKTVEKLNDHGDRIEKLEKDNETNKDKISSNKQDLGELKDQMPEKVD